MNIHDVAAVSFYRNVDGQVMVIEMKDGTALEYPENHPNYQIKFYEIYMEGMNRWASAALSEPCETWTEKHQKMWVEKYSKSLSSCPLPAGIRGRNKEDSDDS